ncbi:MAG: phosphate-starvation-inducible protein PsiF [Acetobacteraceae bacterium]|nr:phosphate-starvation-inducible protein PsiF [Acetobacteraceae bacterium]
MLPARRARGDLLQSRGPCCDRIDEQNQEAEVRFIVASVALAALLTAAAPPRAAAENVQQERMKTCNAAAGAHNLTGDARRSFMSDCLSGKAAAVTTPKTPQERMKSCNAEASGRKLMGDERKQFMSTCLKG